MEKETPQAEVIRLIREQNRVREDEVFGGLSATERAEYNQKSLRINQLEIRLQQDAGPLKRSALDSARATQRSTQWTSTPEVDVPQRDARQPYGDREKDSSEAAATGPAGKNQANKGSDSEGESGGDS